MHAFISALHLYPVMRPSSFSFLDCFAWSTLLLIGLWMYNGSQLRAQKPDQCQKPDVECELAQVALSTGEEFSGWLLSKATFGASDVFKVLKESKELKDERYDDIRTISASGKDLLFSVATLDKFTLVKEVFRLQLQTLEALRGNYFYENTGDILFPTPERRQTQAAQAKLGVNNRTYNAQFDVSIKQNVRGAGSKILLRVEDIRISPTSLEGAYTILPSSFVAKLSVSVAGAGGSVITDWSDISDGGEYIFDVSELRDIKDKLSDLPVYVSIEVREQSFFEGVGPGSFDNLPLTGRFRFAPGQAAFPPPPPTLTATTATNSISLSLNGANADRFRIYRSTKSGFSVGAGSAIDTISTGSYTDKGLIAGRNYYYKAVSVSSTGKESNPSQEVSGRLETNYRITELGDDRNRIAYSRGTLSGQVQTTDGTPVSGAQVSILIPEAELSLGEVQTGKDGRFSTTYRAPGEVGSYTLRVRAQADDGSRRRNVSLTIKERPEWGRDLALKNLSVTDSLVAPDEKTIETGVAVENRGTVSETATVDYRLLSQGAAALATGKQSLSLSAGSGQSVPSSFSLPSVLSSGAYQFRSSVSNSDSLDRERGNNAVAKDVYVLSSTFSTPAYRVRRDTIVGEGTTKAIDGTSITLKNLTSTRVELNVDGEQLDILLDGKPQPPWTSSEKDFLVLRDNIATTDTSVAFEAGKKVTSASVSPGRIHAKRGRESAFQVELPEGQSLDPTEVRIPYGADADTLEKWAGQVTNESVNSSTVSLGLELSPTAEARNYLGWLEWEGDTYTYYKKVAVRPRPIHDVALSNVEVQSTIDGGGQDIPDFIPGAPVEVSGRVANKGDFREREAVELKVEREGKTVYTEKVVPTLARRDTTTDEVGGEETFSFNWPTVGLETGTYTVSVQARHTLDETKQNNSFQKRIELTKPPRVDIAVQKAPSPYEVGSQVPLRVFVGRQDQPFEEAAVTATLVQPNGREEALNLTYNSQSGHFETSFYANYGGNYRVEARAERAPYRPNSAEKLFAKTYVDISSSLSDSTVDVGRTDVVRFRTSNVAGLYGFSADVVYPNETVDFSEASESAFLSAGGSVQTTLQAEDRSGRVVVGGSRLDSEAGGVTSTTGGRLASLAFVGKTAGKASFSLENVSLVDAEGKPMATRVVSDGGVLSVEEEPAAVSVSVPDSASTSVGKDTARVSLVNAFRAKAFDGTIAFPSSRVRVTDVIEGEAFSERGKDETVFAKSINQTEGTVQFSVSRTGGQRGISIGSSSVVRLVYEPKSSGQAPFSFEKGTLISSYENLPLPNFTLNDTLAITGGNQSTIGTPRLAFTPDTTQAAQGDTLSAAVTVDSVSNFYSLSNRLTFNSDQIDFISAQEGDILSRGDTKTSFLSEVEEDTLEVGISRLEGSGVDVSKEDTLYTFQFVRSGTSETEIRARSADLLQPDGAVINSSVDSSLYVERVQASSEETRLFFKPSKVESCNDSTFSVAVQIENVDDLYSVATDLTYNPDQLQVKSINKGGFLGEEGNVSTTLSTDIDSDAGTAVIGLSRLGSEGGFSTTEADTLFIVQFKREMGGESTLELINTGLLRPDGETEIPFTAEPGRVISPQTASDSAYVNADGAVSFSCTGVTVDFKNVTGEDSVVVKKKETAPSNVEGISEQNVSSYRYVVEGGKDLEVGSRTRLLTDTTALLGVENPEKVTVYRRPNPGSGSFTSVQTSFDSNTGNIEAETDSFGEFVFASDSNPLPVELASFDARLVDESTIRLTWRTASETNNSGFEVQRKPANEPESGWRKIGFRETRSSTGTTDRPLRYRFMDSGLPYAADSMKYRLRQIDLDGSSTLTEPIIAGRSGPERLQLLGTAPNPARQQVTVRYGIPQAVVEGTGGVRLRLYDVLGRRVRSVEVEAEPGRHKQQLSVGSLASGVYILRLSDGGRSVTQKLTVVQ